MLEKTMEDVLNQHLEYEAYAASSYLSMASWCEKEGLKGAAGFFYDQSAEETQHMLKMFKYINEAGGGARVPAVKQPPDMYESLQNICEISLNQEKEVTQQINHLVDVSLAEKDYATNNFLQWYVAEQMEEESLFQSLLDMLKLAGQDSQALFFVDREIAALRSQGGEQA